MLSFLDLSCNQIGVGGVSEYLRRGDVHGVVVDTPSVAGLTEALLRVAEDAELRRRLGDEAAPRVRGLHGGQDLSFDRMAVQYANLYSGLVCPARDVDERARDVAPRPPDRAREPRDESMQPARAQIVRYMYRICTSSELDPRGKDPVCESRLSGMHAVPPGWKALNGGTFAAENASQFTTVDEVNKKGG